jgi:hypothetical protein
MIFQDKDKVFSTGATRKSAAVFFSLPDCLVLIAP